MEKRKVCTLMPEQKNIKTYNKHQELNDNEAKYNKGVFA